MKFILRSLVTCLLCAMSVTSAFAAISYTGGLLFENFDALPTSSIGDYYENDIPKSDWGFQRVVPGSDWEGTQIGGSKPNGGDDGMHLSAITSTGTSTSGTVGSAGTGAGDQAIYVIASGSYIPAMGVEIINNSAAPLNSISIRFTQELWRTSGDSSGTFPGVTPGIQNIVPAEWGTSGTGIGSTDFLTASAGFTPVTNLNLVSNTPSSGVASAALFQDGNEAANQATRMATIDLSSSPVAVGESFFLRYTDVNDPGRDAALAIDNFFFSNLPIPDLSLEVARDTGIITLKNSATAGGPALIQGYSITSSIGALNGNAANWKSIANNYDDNSGSGPTQIDADDNWTILSAQIDGGNDLSEFQFEPLPGDGASLAIGQEVELGQGIGAWIPTENENDLAITVTLADGNGTKLELPITYTGNGGAVIRSDFDHDGDIDVNDYNIFRINNHTDISGMSLAQQLVSGDLDGDGDSDARDFLIFQDDYDAFSGGGAFALMAQSVPEPSSLLLLLFGMIALLTVKNRKAVMLVAVMVLMPCSAQATDLDFTTFTAEGIAGNAAATAWATTPSTATLGDSNLQGNVFYGTTDILGKRIFGTINPGSDDDFIGLALGFTPGDGTDTNADFLLLDWKGSTQERNTATANRGLAVSQVLGTPNNDELWGHVGEVAADPNPNGGVTELARGTHSGAISYATDTDIPFSVTYSATNVTVWVNDKKELDLDGTFGSGRLGLYTSSQDDDTPVVFSDFEMFGIDETLTAIVNQTNGTITLKNNSASNISLNYYQLSSEGDSLDSSTWTSLDDIGNEWGESGGSSDSLLAESFFDGEATLAPTQTLVLANAYDTALDAMDIDLMFYDTEKELFFNGVVEYASSTNPVGDYNNDGSVDAADYTVWRDNLGTTTVLDNDPVGGTIGSVQYDNWKSNFGASSAAASASGSAVPEPTTMVMLLLGLAMFVVNRRS